MRIRGSFAEDTEVSNKDVTNRMDNPKVAERAADRNGNDFLELLIIYYDVIYKFVFPFCELFICAVAMVFVLAS